MPAADLANYADVDLSKITTDEKLGLPNFVPEKNLHNNMLASLIIRQECKAKGHIIRPKSFTITGHVDSGKSTVTALCLTAMGIVDMKKVEALEADMAKKNMELQANNLAPYASLVEKGKEAVQRGVTIETRSWPSFITCTLRVKSDGENHKRAVEALNAIAEPFEEIKEADGMTVLKYKEHNLMIDCPGHKKYVHNTSAAIYESQLQIILFPNSSSEASDKVDPFDKALGDESLSVAHSRLGVSSGNTLVLCLSKCDTADVQSSKDRLDTLKLKVPKLIGVKPTSLPVIPIASHNREAHNLLKHSSYDKVDFWKDTTFDVTVPDYKDTSKKHIVSVNIKYAMETLLAFLPVVCPEGTHNRKGGMLQIKTMAKTSSGQVVVGIVNSGCIRVGKIIESCEHKEKFKIMSIETFNKGVETAAVGAHVGIKVKAENRAAAAVEKLLKPGDLMFMDYPEDNKPLCVEYIETRIMYHKAPKSSKKEGEKFMFNLGHQHVLISGKRYPCSIVNILKTTRKFPDPADKKKRITETKVSTKEEPIMGFNDDTIVEAVMRFHHPVCLPVVGQSEFNHTGPLLDHHANVGAMKLIKHLPDGASVDLIELKKKDEQAKKAANAAGGKKKK